MYKKYIKSFTLNFTLLKADFLIKLNWLPMSEI